jgi:hypothetical protein
MFDSSVSGRMRTMKRYPCSVLAVVLSTALLTAVGCVKKPGDRLVGKWEGSGKIETTGSDATAEFLDAAMSRLQMTAEFRADGTMSYCVTVGELPDDNPWQGPWQVVQSNPDRLVIQLTADVDGKTETKRAEIEFLGDDQIALSEPGDETLPKFVLTRVEQ